jgi:hypothetical protein
LPRALGELALDPADATGKLIKALIDFVEPGDPFVTVDVIFSFELGNRLN